MSYQQKLNQLYRRKNNLSHSITIDFSERIQLQTNDALRYIVASMEEVETSYRKNTLEAASKVSKHLEGFNCGFKLQGSVTTQTEIKQNSDIDLVVIINKFLSIERGLPVPNPYLGDPEEDLQDLRKQCEKKLSATYDEVKIEGAKSIEVYLTNPRRKVDVVVANWHETHDYVGSPLTNKDFLKGIWLYDKCKHKRIGPDFPFLRSHNINNHSGGNQVKKLIRFMKNVREDFEIKNLDSFQINCIAYNIIYILNYQELELIKLLRDFLPAQGCSKKVNSPCGKEKTEVGHNPKLQEILNQLIEDAGNPSY